MLRPTRLVVLWVLILCRVTIQGHHCGPSLVRVTVGDAVLWRIIADRSETTTTYTPALNGPTNAVDVTPLRQFNSHHGDFVFRGVRPGTNDLTVGWFYPGTPAGGVCVVRIIVEPRQPGQSTQQVPSGHGQLSTSELNVHIESATLHSLLTNHIPSETPKLLVLTECFGGNIAQSALFKSMPNTAIMTGNSANQQGFFGGYHDDAARALAPSTNKNAADVHHSASVGRHSIHLADNGQPDDPEDTFMASEFPTTAGALSLTAFSLAPVSTSGEVRSRHIVVYSGLPSVTTPRLETHDGRTIPLREGRATEITDAADRDRIKQNFANEPNTTVTTAGGEAGTFSRKNGSDGWDYSGTFEGLQAAIEKAGNEIKNSPDPAREQFILFVGDHGTQGSAVPPQQTTVAPNSRSLLASGVPAISSGSPDYVAMEQDAGNIPGFLLFFDFNSSPIHLKPMGDIFHPTFSRGSLKLEVTPEGNAPFHFDVFTEQVFEIDGNDHVSTMPREGIGIFFPVAESVFLHSLTDTMLDIVLVNNSERGFHVSEIHQLGGAVQRRPDPMMRPKLLAGRFLESGAFELTLRGTINESYAIETMAMNGTWQPVGTIRLSSPTAVFVTPRLTNGASGVYRARMME